MCQPLHMSDISQVTYAHQYPLDTTRAIIQDIHLEIHRLFHTQALIQALTFQGTHNQLPTREKLMTAVNSSTTESLASVDEDVEGNGR